jgi:hypothetical protein
MLTISGIATVRILYSARHGPLFRHLGAFERANTSSWPGAGYFLVPVVTNSRFPIYSLDSWEFHRMTVIELMGGTKYQYWDGVFEAMRYFQNAKPVTIPLADPHTYVQLPAKLNPTEQPMLNINRLAKAFWEFDKSLRIFMRAAIESRSRQRDKLNFWVQSPELDPKTASTLVTFIRYRTLMPCFIIDAEGRTPPSLSPIRGPWKFRMNLLNPLAHAHSYPEPTTSLKWIWIWMFGQGEDFVEQMCVRMELSNPRMTSYKYNVARADFNTLWEAMDSPAVSPSRSPEIEDLSDFITV